MAEFTEVCKQALRMLNADRASECLILCILPDGNVYIDGSPRSRTIQAAKAEEVEKYIMQWAAEHPGPVYPTWREWQNANFPNADSIIRPCVFESEEYFNCVNKNNCECCENERIPADIAEKLGIKPIDNKGGAGK